MSVGSEKIALPNSTSPPSFVPAIDDRYIDE